MKKIKTTLENVAEDILTFYDAASWHFVSVNGIDLGEEKIELQWIFSRYGVRDEIVIFYAISDYETVVPSVVSLIPSAIMSEREVVDMFGLRVEGAEHGLYLDKDSTQHPLRSES